MSRRANHLFNYVKYVLHHPELEENVFNRDVINVFSPEFRRVLSLIESCTMELFYKVLPTLRDKSLLFTAITACIAISVKLFGAYDWIYEKNLYPILIYLAQDYQQNINRTLLASMEKDILAHTDWQACSSIAHIDAFHELLYQPEEKSEEEVVSQAEMEEMLQDSIKFRKNLLEQAGYKTYSLKLIYDSGTWYLRLGNKNLTADQVARKNIRNATVSIKRALLDQIKLLRELSPLETAEWIVNRVLKRGFGLENVLLDMDKS